MAGAQHAGLLGVLVQSGKYRQGDELTQLSPPAATVPDFAAAVDWVLERNRQNGH